MGNPEVKLKSIPKGKGQDKNRKFKEKKRQKVYLEK